MKISECLIKGHGWFHRICQRMAHESHMGPCLFIGFRLKRKYGSHLCHVADDIFRPSFIPGPDGGRYVVHHRNAQCFGHMGDFHIEPRIIDAYEDVRFFINHGLAKHIPKMEEKRDVL